jgi:hypothetical protein
MKRKKHNKWKSSLVKDWPQPKRKKTMTSMTIEKLFSKNYLILKMKNQFWRVLSNKEECAKVFISY